MIIKNIIYFIYFSLESSVPFSKLDVKFSLLSFIKLNSNADLFAIELLTIFIIEVLGVSKFMTDLRV